MDWNKNYPKNIKKIFFPTYFFSTFAMLISINKIILKWLT